MDTITENEVKHFDEVLLSLKNEVDDFESSLEEEMPDSYFESHEIDWAVCLHTEMIITYEKHLPKFSDEHKAELRVIVDRVRKLKKEILAKRYFYPEIIDQVEI